MELDDEIQNLETYYFSKYFIRDLVEVPFIDSNTWRGFSSKFKTKDLASHSLKFAYEHITIDLENFLDGKAGSFSREEFDELHVSQVESLRIHLNIQANNDFVAPTATGTFHGKAYNAYAKVVDLANKFWLLKLFTAPKKPKYAEFLPSLRAALHVPLDSAVLNGTRDLVTKLGIEGFDVPKGGMGIVKSIEKYTEIQQFIRSMVESVPSKRFEGETVSPLVLDTYQAKMLIE